MSPHTYEEEPAVGDYRRSVSQYDSSGDGDHELTLSTPTILGLFFALAMVCACFFGLGYAMGHKTATPAQVYSAATAPANGAAKPAPGSAVATEASLAQDASAPVSDTTSANAQTATVPLASSAESIGTSVPAATPAAPGATRPAPIAAAPAPQPASAVAAGTFVVQVAAVSSQDVANILLSTLEKKGYAVVVRHEPQDQLLHVQIGPFSDRKEADAMRQRVLGDGFNAIVK
jgi:DedD protein